MHNPLIPIIAESANSLFVVDKSEKTVFFPWGSGRQGYYVKSRHVIAKVKKYYKTSSYVCFILLIIALVVFEKNFWGIAGSVVVCFGGWYFAYFLYVSRIVKSLQPAKASHTEIILAKLESEYSGDEDVEENPEIQFVASPSKPIRQPVSNPLFGIQRILYRLSPGQLFILYFFVGIGILMLLLNVHPKFGESPIDFLVACVVCILWGLGPFVVVKNMELEKKDWWVFLNWKLPIILMVIVSWSFAIASLYKFFVMIIT